MRLFNEMEQELKAAETPSDRRLFVAVLGFVVICVSVVAVLFYVEGSAGLGFLAMMLPTFMMMYALRVRRRQAQIYEKYGFKCQNCGKTPGPMRVFKMTNRNFCPHCQLKYLP